MIQVEIAGPHHPQTIDLVPDDVCAMAKTVRSICVKGPAYYGGFLISDMSVLRNWITAEETKLDDPYLESYFNQFIKISRTSELGGTYDCALSATSTAFLTVTISSVVLDCLQPGNFDPPISYLLAMVEFAASTMAFLQSRKAELRRRGNRFWTISEKMQPRGQRIFW